MNNQSIPTAGERCRQGEGGLCQIIAAARHSETGERLVVYQELYGNFDIYVKPLKLFLKEAGAKEAAETAPVSAEKATEEPAVGEAESVQAESGQAVQEALLEFLDAGTYGEKLNILRGMKKKIDEKTVQDLAASLDIVLDGKPLEEQIRDLENCIMTHARFECGRLR